MPENPYTPGPKKRPTLHKAPADAPPRPPLKPAEPSDESPYLEGGVRPRRFTMYAAAMAAS